MSRVPIAPSVHPHACGEHLNLLNYNNIIYGSSPRLWGTLLKKEVPIVGGRFIPTPVGNTKSLEMPVLIASVHPHACGEHAGGPTTNGTRVGSSPRLWGTRSGTFYDDKMNRFIPTPVGNTPLHPSAVTGQPVHPHACGEHGLSGNENFYGFGSSPRLWGTLSAVTRRDSLLRFIPTPVGNTSESERKTFRATVHPHACGEHHG